MIIIFIYFWVSSLVRSYFYKILLVERPSNGGKMATNIRFFLYEMHTNTWLKKFQLNITIHDGVPFDDQKIGGVICYAKSVEGPEYPDHLHLKQLENRFSIRIAEWPVLNRRKLQVFVLFYIWFLTFFFCTIICWFQKLSKFTVYKVWILKAIINILVYNNS